MQGKQKTAKVLRASLDTNYDESPMFPFGQGEAFTTQNVLQPADGTVIYCPTAGNDDGSGSAAAAPKHPEPHRTYLITSRVLTAVSGVGAIVSIALAGGALATPSKRSQTPDREDMMGGIYALLNGLIICESFFCIIAMAACFGLLFTRPHAVLIRRQGNGSLNCLCASVFLMFFFCLYSVVIFAVCAAELTPTALCAVAAVVAAVRSVALLWFFVVLLKNARVMPFDTLYC